MQELNNVLSLIDSYFGGSQWFVFLLLGTGLFFTVYLKFPQIRFFRHALRVVSGKYDHKHDIYVRVYHIIHVAGFFLASFTDTTIVWAFSGITVALMTLPNLIGILILHKEVKKSVDTYWKSIRDNQNVRD